MVTIPQLAKKYNLSYKRIFNCFYKLGIQPVRIENDSKNYYKLAEVEPILIKLANTPPRPIPTRKRPDRPEPEPDIKVIERIPDEYKTILELSRIFNINPKTAVSRLRAAGVDGRQLTRFITKYYDINEVRPVLINPTPHEIAEVETRHTEQPTVEEAEDTEQQEINEPGTHITADDEEETDEAINYTFEPPKEWPDRTDNFLTAEIFQILNEFFGFEGARYILINNYGLKPWKVE